MEWILGIIIAVVVLFVLYDKLIAKNVNASEDIEKVEKNAIYPYKTRDDFLSESERAFYLTLKVYLQDKVVICPKVSHKDIFYVDKGVGKDYMKYFRKISQKHVDFVLCEPNSMKPICGIELDDSSHSKQKRIERDAFVDKVFENAKLKLVHIPLKSGYSSDDINSILEIINKVDNKIETAVTENEVATGPDNGKICSKCGASMILRTSSKGETVGKKFYGCSNYPRCREIVNCD
jgi:hypothetical protein